MRAGDGTRALPPAHLTQGRDAADVHRVGVRAERHAERSVAREEDIVVAARHALGVHGEVAARLGRRAPQVWVKPGEAVGISEEQRGAYGCRKQPRQRAEPRAPPLKGTPTLATPRGLLLKHAPFTFLSRVTGRVRADSCSAECCSRGQDELPVQWQELREARTEVAHGPGTH